MQDYQKEFIEFAIQSKALSFGEFELKSGRESPYFFNAARFSDGAGLLALGRFYAEAIMRSKQEFDMLFGPAYKGIPLAAVTAVELAKSFGLNIPVAYNRKEVKAHGERGSIVGAPLAGNVLIIDDVITAGTAIREAISIIEDAGAHAKGVVIALDRQEKGQGNLSAIQEVEQSYRLDVISIADLTTLISMLQDAAREGEKHERSDLQSDIVDFLPKIMQYREKYGI